MHDIDADDDRTPIERLQDELEEVKKEREGLRESLTLTRASIKRCETVLGENVISEHTMRRSRDNWRAFAIPLAILVVGLFGLLFYDWQLWRDAATHAHELASLVDDTAANLTTAETRAQECEAAALAAANAEDAPTISAASSGYYTSDGMHIPWPDASGYPSARFTADCEAVCEIPSTYHGEEGRVLTIDPAHLVCVCFHASSPWPVTRWIGWARQ